MPPFVVAAEVDVIEQHALREQARERLVALHESQVAHHLGPEARVQQVQDRVLDAADVLVHRHPVVVARVDHRRRVRARVAHVVPRRIDERVHRVGLALRRLAARRARDVDEVGALAQRIAAAVGHAVLGQHDRQVLLRHRHRAARLAMDDRDRRAPVALARDAPVAQAVRRALLAQALGREVGARPRRPPPRTRSSSYLTENTQRPRVLVGVPRLPEVGRELLAFHGDHLLDRQAVLLGEREVALVVRRHAHHRAVAVRHEHVVADPHLDRLVR